METNDETTASQLQTLLTSKCYLFSLLTIQHSRSRCQKPLFRLNLLHAWLSASVHVFHIGLIRNLWEASLNDCFLDQ